MLIHTADHLRRGIDSVSADVLWAGNLGFVFEVGIVVLIFMGHRLAPQAAVAVGFGLAVGYAFVHFTPSRGWLSDSFPSGSVSAVSWFAALFETAGALLLGVAGWSARE